MKQLQGEQSGNGADYVPFSEEWEKEVSKLPKGFLIQMLKKANLERIEYREQLKDAIKTRNILQEEDKQEIDRLKGLIKMMYFTNEK